MEIKMKNKNYSNVDEFLNASLRHKEEYLVEMDGISLWVHPQVISPKYSKSPLFIKDNWDIKKGMEVLDMGTGTGILAIFAALHGARSVMAVDINPYACQIAKKNVKLNRQDKKIKIIKSDLFESVSGKFDRIIFNVPHWNRKADNEISLTYATYDKDYNMFKRFLSQAKRHLDADGKILVGFRQQNENDMNLFESHIDKEGYKIENKIKQNSSHTRLLYYLIPK